MNHESQGADPGSLEGGEETVCSCRIPERRLVRLPLPPRSPYGNLTPDGVSHPPAVKPRFRAPNLAGKGRPEVSSHCRAA
jgi:hypothetical protein